MAHVSPLDFVHPNDKAALEQLKSFPLLDVVVKKWSGLNLERSMYSLDLASKIRLSPRQLPEIYRLLPPVSEAFGISEPRFFLAPGLPQALTYGARMPTITVTSGLLTALSEEDVQVVLAHECGHIASQHLLYHDMAVRVVSGAARMSKILAQLRGPMVAALLAWSRASELSADRAAALYVGRPEPVVSVMMRLAGGEKWITDSIDMDGFIAQAREYEDLASSKWEAYLQWKTTAASTHPFLALRAKEVLAWCETATFKRVRGSLDATLTTRRCDQCGRVANEDWRFCRHCGNEIQQALIADAST